MAQGDTEGLPCGTAALGDGVPGWISVPGGQGVVGHEGEVQEGEEILGADHAEAFGEVGMHPAEQSSELLRGLARGSTSSRASGPPGTQRDTGCHSHQEPVQVGNGVRREGLDAEHREHDAKPHCRERREGSGWAVPTLGQPSTQTTQWTGRQIPWEGLQGSCAAEQWSSTLPVLPGRMVPLRIQPFSCPGWGKLHFRSYRPFPTFSHPQAVPPAGVEVHWQSQEGI